MSVGRANCCQVGRACYKRTLGGTAARSEAACVSLLLHSAATRGVFAILQPFERRCVAIATILLLLLLCACLQSTLHVTVTVTVRRDTLPFRTHEIERTAATCARSRFTCCAPIDLTVPCAAEIYCRKIALLQLSTGRPRTHKPALIRYCVTECYRAASSLFFALIALRASKLV